jgi:hypothetical protein
VKLPKNKLLVFRMGNKGRLQVEHTPISCDQGPFRGMRGTYRIRLICCFQGATRFHPSTSLFIFGVKSDPTIKKTKHKER